MIRVRRPAKAPPVLRGAGANARQALEKLYERHSTHYLSGQLRFSFNPGIYGHPAVKAALRKTQHDKCAFCESKFVHVAYGDVEHFRPKNGWAQSKKEAMHVPGYWWLAYEWTNLLFACQICNQRKKRNLFPLRTAKRRTPDHRGDVSAEDPLFIDPSGPDERTEALISFRDEVIHAVRGNARAQATIESLGLDRGELDEPRLSRLHIVRLLVRLWRRGPSDPEYANADAKASGVRSRFGGVRVDDAGVSESGGSAEAAATLNASVRSRAARRHPGGRLVLHFKIEPGGLLRLVRGLAGLRFIKCLSRWATVGHGGGRWHRRRLLA